MAFSLRLDIQANHQASSTYADCVEVSLSHPNKIGINLTSRSHDEALFKKLQDKIGSHKTLTLCGLAYNEDNQIGRTLVSGRGGKLSYDDNPGTLNRSKPAVPLESRQIFKGYYEGVTEVAIQKVTIQKEQKKDNITLQEVERERQILQFLESHENFIRYYCYESVESADVTFVYIATELCLCSVQDLYYPTDEDEDFRVQGGKIKLDALKPKDILFQATRGLEYLHRNGIIHRNVKPSSFLIKKVSGAGDHKYVVKITDFRKSRIFEQGKSYSGTCPSGGWLSPEILKKNQQVSTSLDVFILGCFFHYILKKGVHPFGFDADTRKTRIQDKEDENYHSNWKLTMIESPKAVPLIKRMLKFEEKQRPKLSQVLEDDYFKEKEHYKIYDYPTPGLCIIFNQEEFLVSKLNRPGSRKDRDELEKTFVKLGFEVRIYDNKQTQFIKDAMSDLREEMKFAEYGSLVVCILSHGEQGSFLGFDGCVRRNLDDINPGPADYLYNPINVDELKYNFSADKCPDLFGKPKMFIIQTCQGSLIQTSDGIDTISNADSSNVSPEEKFDVAPDPQAHHLNTYNSNEKPPIMDFFTIKATIPGFVALRNPNDGSPFIQSLCGALQTTYCKRDASDKDLEALMREVQNDVNKNLKDQLIKVSGGKLKLARQTIQWEASGLSKHIRFKAVPTAPIFLDS